MKTVFVLTTYEYSTYSYSGIEVDRTYIHTSMESAVLHAKELGLVIVNYCKDADKECTVSKEEVLDYCSKEAK